MTPLTKERILWGWLRLFLGFAQIALVGLSVGALFSVGVKPITWIFVIGATALTVVSRLIYKGRTGPKSSL
jgi:hypothetical protein